MVAAAGRLAAQLSALLTLVGALAACGESAPAVLEGRPAGPYRLALTLDPPHPQTLAETTLDWQLTHASSGLPVTGLAVLHERVIHNFIVNLDFSSFAHIHHEDFKPLSADDLAHAHFTLPYRFPSAGRYRIVSEFTYRERNYVKHFDVTVGTPAASARAAPVARLTRATGEYRGVLQLSPAVPVAGYETELVLDLARDGAPVTDLALYLGTEAHVAVWRDDGAEYGHTHSYTPHMAQMLAAMHTRDQGAGERSRRLAEMMVQMMNMPAELIYHGPRIPVHYVFPSPGYYHVFIQCAPGGNAAVFDFVFEVVAYAEGMNTRVQSIVDGG